MTKSTLSEGLKAAAISAPPKPQKHERGRKATPQHTVMVGAHFSPEVRRVLFLVQAEPENAGKTMKQLLGEAINDLCAKYRKPQPYQGEV